MTPMPNSNPSQKIIMNTMPIWFTVISLGFASGLVLYWLTNNVLTIVQTAGYHKLRDAGVLGKSPATSGSSSDKASKPGDKARRSKGK